MIIKRDDGSIRATGKDANDIFQALKSAYMSSNPSRFDTNKPILQSLIEEAEAACGILYDSVFTQALKEYHTDEATVQDQMDECDTHEFMRDENGWEVNKYN